MRGGLLDCVSVDIPEQQNLPMSALQPLQRGCESLPELGTTRIFIRSYNRRRRLKILFYYFFSSRSLSQYTRGSFKGHLVCPAFDGGVAPIRARGQEHLDTRRLSDILCLLTVSRQIEGGFVNAATKQLHEPTSGVRIAVCSSVADIQHRLRVEAAIRLSTMRMGV